MSAGNRREFINFLQEKEGKEVKMTIDEAIKILTQMSKSTAVSSLEDCIVAIKLGTEALKREQKRRHFSAPDVMNILPGETK